MGQPVACRPLCGPSLAPPFSPPQQVFIEPLLCESLGLGAEGGDRDLALKPWVLGSEAHRAPSPWGTSQAQFRAQRCPGTPDPRPDLALTPWRRQA